ncbi:MAG: UDP-N-acetylmuramoyl-tripeptide--D-alanyl-D-alanine ligase [Ruminococcaceae bacterium]|nr:UDP-N-acetylmuramoyl-tripeptide--D-alanyl-D-alanine ligase [Oscillospiraceae bacterium]
MEKITLAEVAAAVGGAIIGDQKKAGAVEITDICIDSRSVEEGCLFFAIVGENFDGHTFVRTALNTGAAAAVCSSYVEGVNAPIIMVGDTRTALLRLAGWWRKRFDIHVVGLTGSVGKTTTKDMVAAVLRQRYDTLATEGNLNNEIGLPRMCLRLNKSHQAAVFEMGMSGFGEISRLTRTACPTIGLITNIGVSHIEQLGSREGILKAKMEILEGMDKDAPLILNGDDDMLITAASGRKNVLLYGIDNEDADCRACDVELGEEGIRFILIYKEQSYQVELPVVGRHNVYNACAAFLCGVTAGVEPEAALRGLRDYIPDSRRQKIVRKKGITFIEDCYNASPDSISASLAVLRALPCEGKRVAVLGDMLELGDYARKAHHDCGVAARDNGVNILLAFGTNAIYYMEGAGETVHSRLYDDKAEMAADLADMLKAGDAVLFKASRGMKLEEVIAQTYKNLGIAE